jgi:hypothetical protein
LEKWEKVLMIHTVEAVSIKELKKWIKTIARDKLQDDED